MSMKKITRAKLTAKKPRTNRFTTNRLITIPSPTTSNQALSKNMLRPVKSRTLIPPKCTTMRTTIRRSVSLIRTLPLRRIFRPTIIPLRTMRRAPLEVEATAAARITAAAEIVVVTVAATVAVADVGAAVADVNVVVGGALRARA
jgi:hypothetical protein